MVKNINDYVCFRKGFKYLDIILYYMIFMEISDDFDFLDLACIIKIAPEAVLEKFGSQINTNFFDASNLAGTLKQKGLVNFTSTFPGPNTIIVTESGKQFIGEAESKSNLPFDPLDADILKQLAGGKRLSKELAPSLNIRPKDLALRIYKLNKQGDIIYELKNGTVELMLTEKGFLKVKEIQGVPETPVQVMMNKEDRNKTKIENNKVNIADVVVIIGVIIVILLILLKLFGVL
jgi:predicted transcriptional regulator